MTQKKVARAEPPIIPSDIRVSGIQAHRLFDVRDAGFRLPEIHKRKTEPIMRQGVISIERNRSLKFNPRLGQSVLDKP
jgi:hypothetical protein